MIPGIVASQKFIIQPTDPNFASVVSLLHLDGTDGQTTTTDQISTNAWSFFGSAQLDTSDKKFGTASLILDGAGDYISTPDKASLRIASGTDYTIEAFGKLRALTRTYMLANKRAGGGAEQFSFQVNGDGSLTFAEFNGTPVLVATSAVSAIAINNWYHLAFSKQGTTGRLFINGALVATVSQTGAVASNVAPLNLGRDGFATTRDWDGWIDEFRFTNGVARYTSAFTAPTAPFPNK